MKLHEIENVGGDWCRKAVPGGWMYFVKRFTIVRNGYGESWKNWCIEGATYVPDPTAEHVREAAGGAQ